MSTEQYVGVKLVKAEPMMLDEFEEKFNRSVYGTQATNSPGYCVTYPDGYVSWCPKGQFEEANRQCEGMTFGHAIEVARQHGHRIARKGWNGKGMFVYYVSGGLYPAQMEAIKGKFSADLVPYDPYLAFKHAGEKVVPWLASQSDILADDWMIV